MVLLFSFSPFILFLMFSFFPHNHHNNNNRKEIMWKGRKHKEQDKRAKIPPGKTSIYVACNPSMDRKDREGCKKARFWVAVPGTLVLFWRSSRSYIFVLARFSHYFVFLDNVPGSSQNSRFIARHSTHLAFSAWLYGNVHNLLFTLLHYLSEASHLGLKM